MSDNELQNIKKGIITRLFERNQLLFIGLSFVLIVVIMTFLVLLALNRLAAMHNDLENIINQQNTKIELVQTMRFVVRERLIAMHQLVIEDDPFARDEITLHFAGQANQFLEAREKLKAMEHDNEARAMLDELTKLTVIGTPFQQAVIELLSKDDMVGGRKMLKEKAMPAQLNVVHQCDNMLEYYKNVAHKVELEAHKSHDSSTLLLWLLGGAGGIISLLIAYMVLTRIKADRKALQQAHDELEDQVKARTRELSISIAQLAEAQQISHVGHWEWDLEHDAMNWSDEVFRIFGFAPQSFKPDYETLLKTVAPEDLERIQTTIDKVMSNNEPLDFENHIVQPSGNLRIVHQQAKLDFNQDGKLLKILGTIQDVTESKAAEQRLQLAARVFENASEGIIITDADNNIVDVNRAFTVITGYSKHDVIGQNPRIFKSGKHETEFYQEMWKTLLENGVWQGELWGRRKSGEIYPKWESISTIRLANGKINNYLAIFRDITEAKKYEERLWKLAHYDNLCGVANRSLMYANLHQAISQAKRDKHLVAFMLFDLDHFKSINDTQGHDAGDQLLVHVSNQLKSSIRDTDTVARLGGDEFTVILGNMHNRENVLHVVDKIRKALGSSLVLQNGDSVVVSASIGIALYPDDAADVETLMKCADRAMYHAKELGRNNAQLFREGMSHETRPESPSFNKEA